MTQHFPADPPPGAVPAPAPVGAATTGSASAVPPPAVSTSTQAMSDSWGASAVLFGAGSLLWPLVFFLAFFARAAMLAAENSSVPHYGGAWQETIEIVAISGSYVGWVAPSLLALLVGLGFLVTPNADIDSQSVLRPLPFVAALIGGFMLAWTVLAVVVLSTHGPTATSEGGQQLWGLLFITPVSVVLALVLGRLDFRPVAKRAQLLQAAIERLEREHEHLADTGRFYGDPRVTEHTVRSPWKRPLLVQGCLAVVVFFAFWLLHDEPVSTAVLEAIYVAAVGALVFLVISMIQLELIASRLAKLAGHEVRSKLELVGGVILAVGVGLLVLYNLWFVLAEIRPIIVPIGYALGFIGAAWIASPLTLRRSAWPAYVLRDRERTLARMRAKLAQLTAEASGSQPG
ncbi:hypothetical protein [Leucobacter komagatae]|uniref:Uncharacterized protein n=1 Tax=Leucobacter komagatae TaxID=55969 RepID=A0A0D0H809_9MICO|nr:hypothetical protein [Leucobacter komagatae]KIP53365.1 hypothetical protein SD72_03830 [Leucobacter komagatae]